MVFENNPTKLNEIQSSITEFLKNDLKLTLHSKNNLIVKAKHGVKFLGVKLYPAGRRLTERNRNRVIQKVNFRNLSSYHGLVAQHENSKLLKKLNWHILNHLP